VERSELTELHYITPIDNVPSIVKHGILSNHGCKTHKHLSVAMSEIQDKRARIRVPGGKPLHEYVNLYICARNPMLFKRKDVHEDLCVLRVSPDVLDLPDVVVSDSNAVSEYARFASAPKGLVIVDKELTFAEYWTDPDPIQKFRKAAKKCAEVLVPDRVSPRFLLGAYLSCNSSLEKFQTLQCGLKCDKNSHFFFR